MVCCISQEFNLYQILTVSGCSFCLSKTSFSLEVLI
uniref:Uncharacterized protein n=1 Tax=Arundo donax TaxID=35708 RepID=A0A0A9ERS1_ARUDO